MDLVVDLHSGKSGIFKNFVKDKIESGELKREDFNTFLLDLSLESAIEKFSNAEVTFLNIYPIKKTLHGKVIS